MDHFGIKRLYYEQQSERTAFATRPGPLTGLAGVGPNVDLGSVYSYLNFGFVPAPRSIFGGLLRLPPGHGPAARRRAVRRAVLGHGIHGTAYAADRGGGHRVPVDGAGRRRCPPGHLPEGSGRVSQRRNRQQHGGGARDARLTGERVQAFSVGFSEETYDELEYARITARHFEAAHYTASSGRTKRSRPPRLVEAYDEPSGNNSAIGALACAEAARECGVRRLLAGDGGDEIFGGNERYRTDRIFARRRSRIPAIVRRGLLEPALSRIPEESLSLFGRARRYVRRARLPNPERYYFSEFLFARAHRNAPGRAVSDAVSKRDLRHPRYPYRQARATAELNRLMYIDLKVSADNDLLGDRAAEMAGSRSV